MARLCALVGADTPHAQARWWAVDGPGWTLRWERHTEFSSWTVFAPSGPVGARVDPLDRLPAAWLADFPKDVLVATTLDLRIDSGALDVPLVSDGVQIGSEVLEGAARVFTDFRDDDSGKTRFRVLLRSNDAPLAGRLALILLEIETYRLMALLAFPLAGEATVKLRAIESEAGELAAKLASEEGVEADRLLLSRLITLSGEAEALNARTSFRFGAADAYHGLVRDRVASLREAKIAGLQTIEEFMERRLAPAMRTCATVAEREAAVIARIARAGAMLDTRIKVADEATSAALLGSMNARADASLRLQRTVEGLSVAAISYYALMLLSYPVKALEHIRSEIDATILLGMLAPVIAILVWLTLRAVRRKIEDR